MRQTEALNGVRHRVVEAQVDIGQVYRLRVSKIPLKAGFEVYPSVEIINRLYPPQGLAWKFPIPIHLTSRDMEFALQGRYVTRVIYLEDPRAALPAVANPNVQRYFDVGTTEDPLHTADQLGRPMAILRLGSRVPRLDRTTGSFLFNSPPLQLPGARLSFAPMDRAPQNWFGVWPRVCERHRLRG